MKVCYHSLAKERPWAEPLTIQVMFTATQHPKQIIRQIIMWLWSQVQWNSTFWLAWCHHEHHVTTSMMSPRAWCHHERDVIMSMMSPWAWCHHEYGVVWSVHYKVNIDPIQNIGPNLRGGYPWMLFCETSIIKFAVLCMHSHSMYKLL